MGSKIEAKDMMRAAGVPVLPDATVSNEEDLDPHRLRAAASDIGFPILVKAAFGGGGRGMRIVHSEGELLDAVQGARREAASAFGDGTVFLEKFVESPRHIEVQIFGDRHGTLVHLGERECSIQRRYQKIIEEAPSTAVDKALRDQLGRVAIAAGKALAYEGAGTVEFVMAQDDSFYFLEVNTRLQVEHPVTELVTGIDLVRAQLLVAAGEPLPPEMLNTTPHGHAIEARLYAEDVAAGFLPVAGALTTLEFPQLRGVRVDAGFTSGSQVSTHYDPMLAKVIGYGKTREEACGRLARALRETRIHGVMTNRDLLVGILRDSEFRSGAIDTAYLQRHDPVQLMAGANDASTIRIHALVAALAAQAGRRNGTSILPGLPSGWRTVHSQPQRVSFVVGDGDRRCELPVRPLRGHRLSGRLATAITSDCVGVSRHCGSRGRRCPSALPDNPMRREAFRRQRIGLHDAVRSGTVPRPQRDRGGRFVACPDAGRGGADRGHRGRAGHRGRTHRRAGGDEDGTHGANPNRWSRCRHLGYRRRSGRVGSGSRRRAGR